MYAAGVCASGTLTTTYNPFTGKQDYVCVGSTSTGGTPGGSNTQIQYNNSGAFAGTAVLTAPSTSQIQFNNVTSVTSTGVTSIDISTGINVTIASATITETISTTMTVTSPVTSTFMKASINPNMFSSPFSGTAYANLFGHAAADFGGLSLTASTNNAFGGFPMLQGDSIMYLSAGDSGGAAFQRKNVSWAMDDTGMLFNFPQYGFYDSVNLWYPTISLSDDTFQFKSGDGVHGAYLSARSISAGDSTADVVAGSFTSFGTAADIVQFSSATQMVASVSHSGNGSFNGLTVGDGYDITIGVGAGTRFGQASSKIAFFGGTPVQRQSSTTDLKQAIVNLNMMAGAGASDLNLNGGNFTTTGGVTAGSITVTGQNTTSTTTIVTAANSQTSDLAEWKTFSGNIVDRIGSNGLVTFSSMSVPGWALLGGSVAVNSSVYASSVAVKVGASAGNLAHVGGVFFDHYVSSGNTGTTETDLYVDTIPINGLNQAGQKVITMYAGTFVNSATATRQLKVKVSTTTIFDTGAISVSAASEWTINLVVIRDSASTVRCTVWMTLTGASTGAYDNYATVGGLTFSNANTIKVTGTAGAVGAATNDIVAQMGYMEYQPEQ